MTFSEVYQAIQTGVADGPESLCCKLYAQQMHEVQTRLPLSDHG